ncbi:hypothetical protein GCM10023238_03610 [Streptomyces heliomycini]
MWWPAGSRWTGAFLDAAVEEITGGATVSTGAPGGATDGRTGGAGPAGRLARSRDSMAAAIRASATPSRTDRLFPGDIAQFATAGGGLAFGHGAAGVLYALAESGAGRDEDGSSAAGADQATAVGHAAGFPRRPSPASPGRWSTSGHRDRALDLAELLLDQSFDRLPGLHSGTAGVGLALTRWPRPPGRPPCARRPGAAPS